LHFFIAKWQKFAKKKSKSAINNLASKIWGCEYQQ
jgi:hypothetical protein